VEKFSSSSRVENLVVNRNEQLGRHNPRDLAAVTFKSRRITESDCFATVTDNNEPSFNFHVFFWTDLGI
jgi:hypothetical protein